MENLSPALMLLWQVKRSLERGLSVASGVELYLRRSGHGKFQNQVRRWWSDGRQVSSLTPPIPKSALSSSRRRLLQILEAGLHGHAILQTLEQLEDELILSCENEIEEHVALLPLWSMIPLLFFIFPSIMLLLIVPLLNVLQI